MLSQRWTRDTPRNGRYVWVRHEREGSELARSVGSKLVQREGQTKEVPRGLEGTHFV